MGIVKESTQLGVKNTNGVLQRAMPIYPRLQEDVNRNTAENAQRTSTTALANIASLLAVLQTDLSHYSTTISTIANQVASLQNPDVEASSQSRMVALEAQNSKLQAQLFAQDERIRKLEERLQCERDRDAEDWADYSNYETDLSEHQCDENQIEFNWKHSSSFTGLPSDAVYAGQDSDGAPIYVGRAHHEGDHLPAKVIPSKRIAYVPYGGREVSQHLYEVLCGTGFAWVPSSYGQIPPHAVSSGCTASGEPLYIGRGNYEGSTTPGKIHPSHRCLYIPYGGAEISLQNYEVLVYAESWVKSQIHQGVPPQAVVGGHDSDGATIYVGKAHHAGEMIPAKVIPSKQACYIPYGGQEVFKDHYEILTGSGYMWIGSACGHVPANAVVGGMTSNGEQLYVGRAHLHGSLTPGKIQPSHQCLYIPYGGEEKSIREYEVLIKQGGL